MKKRMKNPFRYVSKVRLRTMIIIVLLITGSMIIPTTLIILTTKDYVAVDSTVTKIDQSNGSDTTYYYIEYTYDNNHYKFISNKSYYKTGHAKILVNPKNPTLYSNDIVSTSRSLRTTGLITLATLSIHIIAELLGSILYSLKDDICEYRDRKKNIM